MQQNKTPSDTGNILIVDDMPHNLRLLSTMLVEKGYNVRAMTNGSMALKSVQYELPDIILLDINMPDMDGYQVCKHLKENEYTQHVPVIFISALDEVINKVRAFASGGVDFITKPFQVEEVLIRIKNQLTIQKTRHALQASEDTFRSILDFTYNWEYLINPDGTYRYVSPSCERISGYRADEFMQDHTLLARIIHPEDQPLFASHICSIDKSLPICFLEFRIITRAGDERWLYHTCQQVFDRHGTWIGTRVSNHDITDQRRSEDGLRKFHRAVEQSPTSIVITDLVGNIEYVNPKFSHATGYTYQEAMGANPRILKSGELSRDMYKQLWDTISSGGEWRGEFHNRRKNGELFWEIASISPIFDDKGIITHYLAIKEDITDRKRTEEELRNAYYHLKKLNERLQYELALARRIQQSLLPPPSPGWGYPKMVCYNHPAREVGGDLYAYYAFPCDITNNDSPTPYTITPGINRYALAIGDVSGKGMPAAMLMSASMASFHSMIGQCPTPSKLLAMLDQALTHYTRTTRQNCAMLYVEVNIFVATQQEEPSPSPASAAPARFGFLRIANAGCIPPLIKKRTGDVIWTDVCGVPLGVGLGSARGYQEIEVELDPGDMIILTSDGVVEAQNAKKELFGFGRLEQAVAQSPHTTVEDVMKYIRKQVDTFVAGIEPHDDTTIVVTQV